ncbi:MAG: bifunctional folylpolyglutamate synthase/dihydrofolate synthase [Nannocystaceae bacterium]
MTSENWRQALYARRKLGVDLKLESVKRVYQQLGSPGSEVPIVHIVGTNGKGSTACLTAHGLQRAGKRVGLFTSPHLHELRERIQIDRVPVADTMLDDFLRRVFEAESRVLQSASKLRLLTFFEILTLAGLAIFRATEVDFIVLEAGLGGRLDATRVAPSQRTLITRIGMDHQSMLGDNLAAIAGEKAAVIHAGAPCLAAPQRREARAVIEQVAEEQGSEVTWVSPLAQPPKSLRGAHQRINAALALAAVQSFVPDATASWLDDAEWPGRLEQLQMGGGTVLFDVAHNPDGISSLADYLRVAPRRERVIAFGCMGDKAAEDMLEGLFRLHLPIWLTACAHPGAVPPDVLAARSPESPQRVFKTTGPAFRSPIDEVLARGGEVCVCGSCYLAGEVRGKMLGLASGPPRASDPLVRTRRT